MNGDAADRAAAGGRHGQDVAQLGAPLKGRCRAGAGVTSGESRSCVGGGTRSRASRGAPSYEAEIATVGESTGSTTTAGHEYGGDIPFNEPQSTDGFSPVDYVERITKSHILLARSQGAGAGALTAASMLSVAAGPGIVLTTRATTVLADLVSLSWIQMRMGLHIAAAYGHDVSDPVRAQEVLALAGLDLAAGAGAAPVEAKGGMRVDKRLLGATSQRQRPRRYQSKCSDSLGSTSVVLPVAWPTRPSGSTPHCPFDEHMLPQRSRKGVPANGTAVAPLD